MVYLCEILSLPSSRIGTAVDRSSGKPNTVKVLSHAVKYFLIPEESGRSAFTVVYETVTHSSNDSIFHAGYSSRTLLSPGVAAVLRWSWQF